MRPRSRSRTARKVLARPKLAPPLAEISPSAAAIARKYVQDVWGYDLDAIKACAARGYLELLDLVMLRARFGLDAFGEDLRRAQHRQASAELERAIVAFCVREMRERR